MEGEILNVIPLVALLVFVLSSMLAMGFGLTIPQIIEPVRSVKLVVISLAVNFVRVPLAGWAVGELLSLDESLMLGLALIATAA